MYRLRCAALQLLGVVVEVEGPRSVKRCTSLLPMLLPVLAQAADEAAVDEDDAADDIYSACAAWQEAYHALRLLEKLLSHAGGHLQWDAGEEVQLMWEAVCVLQLHPHMWVRLAAARLLAWALDNDVGPAMLRDTHGLPGRLAWQLVKQLETPGLDDVLGGLAAGNLARVAPLLYEQDAALGRLAGEDAHADSSEHAAKQDPALGVSLQWVASKVAQLAGGRALETATTRRHALGLVAGLTAALGAARVDAILPVLLRPLYRLSEGASTEGDAAVQDVAAEVMASIRCVFLHMFVVIL